VHRVTLPCFLPHPQAGIPNRLWKNHVGTRELRWSARVAQQKSTPAGCSKGPDFSPAQPWQLFHPPAPSLPRQTLCLGTRLVPSKAAASDQRWFFQACLLLSLGMAPVLVPLRPSSEHILIVRAPGARDQHGCHFILFIVHVLRARRAPGRSLPCWRTFSAPC